MWRIESLREGVWKREKEVREIEGVRERITERRKEIEEE